MTPGRNLLPPLGLLRRHLEANGWIRVSGTSALDNFVLPPDTKDDDELRIILNRDPQGPDADRRIEQAVITLSQLYGETPQETASKIRMVDFDVIRARLPDDLVIRDSINLRMAEKFVSGLRRLLASSALAQLTGSAVADKSDPVAALFVESCRLGHTFKGSFGFTIESPVGPNSFDAAAPTPEPFERRVVERLAQGLMSVERATKLGDTEILEEQINDGCNINMMEALSTLVEQTDGSTIVFDFSLSDAWLPRTDKTVQAVIPPDALAVTAQIIRKHRGNTLTKGARVTGYVYKLELRGSTDLFSSENIRNVTIEVAGGELDGKTLGVRLTPDQYLVALHAHEAGRLVLLEGTLTRLTRGLALSNLTGFEAL
ncbi:MAG: hypothetical protein EOQ86_30355 [Mesorhizobium sp.]|uniref:hypothetical protein n=1 Tax=Mesorhizobium sp. TaxID=1871066 RepID=UPI000FE9741C|nr:hypothetical protein [Mesorhizobium sp.]RWH69494.1 MAG: hypothetical protein EOQ85_32940 [Mesorhizobium sp.]RWH76360.1 MAG: hypothetical protein EOQ86_30355 [Mesorhizobium sp.]RWH83510.1 MAG: hypothetical protein EOQ87_32645 [Mesorhizobium sp.]RWH91527.1 MAG: hypothetical protein EOQ88_31660 [Mesorhizobium sp.]RWH95800.1 MAG: hypothetical protein EOQ89_30315 [Mesorhizobium sp.]